jgi:hypothetical protein
MPSASASSRSDGARPCAYAPTALIARFDAPQFTAQIARQPVVFAQAIKHGAAHTLGGIGLELGAESPPDNGP